MKENQEVIESIKEAFQQKLPGMESHLKLTPYRKLTVSIPENRREGAVMMMLYEKKGGLYFPLILRHSYEGVHSNQISFPGGKVEKSDPDLLYTAIRETEEEIGIHKELINPLGEMSQIYIPPSNFLVSAYVSFLSVAPTFIKQEREVKEIMEVSLNELLSIPIKTTKVKLSNGSRLKTPYFEINGRVVWGATAAILSEFRDIYNSMYT